MNPVPHRHPQEVSQWVRRFAPLIASGGAVLDLASGNGRHARFLEAGGWRVEAVDRDAEALATLAEIPGIACRQADLESGIWPYAGVRFDGIVVTNYLYRPLFPLLIDALAEGGILIYETFMLGNERFGRPANPDFLLRPGELLEAFVGRLSIVAFEQGEIALPKPAAVQRLCAVNASDSLRIRLPESCLPVR